MNNHCQSAMRHRLEPAFLVRVLSPESSRVGATPSAFWNRRRDKWRLVGLPDTLDSPTNESTRSSPNCFWAVHGVAVGRHGTSDHHEALVQVVEVKVHRDLNKDMQRTGDTRVTAQADRTDTGLFGINQN